MELQNYLAECDQRYSEENHMLGTVWQGPGYHTRIPNGTWAHPTREALDYALGLLRTGEPGHIARASDILRKVLILQDTNPTNKTYGIWPWLLEEPLNEMAPPDWNWADFCGARLAQILVEHEAVLPDGLATPIRAALGHAAWSIFRRNVQPSYTNIAIMGAGVTLAAGELLSETRLIDYGRRRLRNIVEHTHFHGSFNEYNSPTYTLVAVHECERILQLVKDPAARADAERLRFLAWLMIADHFHPATGQWAGPHSRAYGDWLRPDAARYLSATTGVLISPHPSLTKANQLSLTHLNHLPCPADLTERFQQLPRSPLSLRQRFIRQDRDADSTWGTTWMNETACLGSINYDSLWTQRRGLIAYWHTSADPAVALRLRFLHDGQDFASAAVRNVQQDFRVLSAVHLLTNKGDFHLSLDRPADGRFTAETFRLRYELNGQGVSLKALDQERFELSAGDYKAVIQTAAGRFGSTEISWQPGQAENQVYLDAVCYQGRRRYFDPKELQPVILAAGLELLPIDQPPAQAVLSMRLQPNRRAEFVWPVEGTPLTITVPIQGVEYWS